MRSFIFILLVIISLDSGCGNISDSERLVWSDEFSVDGLPDSTKWTYDIGHGSNGWGNNESQYYTNELKNSFVKDGLLTIRAIKDVNGWTSARLKTAGKKTFRYGKVVFRARLPTGVGTWPALWMLGENISTVGWPACGEIDVMEHVGRNPGIVQAAMHTRSSHGNTINKGETPVPTYSTEFHNYAVEWTKDKITFFVDDHQYYQYAPEKTPDSWPYDLPFFIIMNVAIGGNFGGAVADDLSVAEMQVDYVRVYAAR